MNKFLSIMLLSLTTLISAQSSIAKKFIYDDETRTYTEIRDDRYYNGNNNNQYYSGSSYDNNRYVYNNDQRIDRTLPKPSWDWKVGQDLPAQFRSEQYQVKSNDSPRLYSVGSDEQWYRINGDYVLADDEYEIIRILK